MPNKQEKLVSIILPVYNGEDNVSNAIDSILCQTYKNIELIIINDCSTDNTLEIVKKYESIDSRVKVISNLTNLKLPQALNRGFREAKGSYFSWTSDDNLYKENAIERMLMTMEEHPEVDMVYANYTNIDIQGNELDEAQLAEPQKLLVGNVIGACFLYKREIAIKVGEYDPMLFLAEDYDYWIRIMKVGKILHINDNLYYYRRHAGSLTETQKSLIGMQTFRTMEKHFLFMSTIAGNKKQKYTFFDQLLVRLGDNEDEKKEVEKMLVKVDGSYLLYKKYMILKEKIRRMIRRFEV